MQTIEELNTLMEKAETKIAFLEEAMAEMSPIINEQRIKIEKLEELVKQQGAILKDLSQDKMPSVRPPHY
jgi:uncharacterized coiled-coil protein SlyX